MRAAGRLRWSGPATRECHQRRQVGRARLDVLTRRHLVRATPWRGARHPGGDDDLYGDAADRARDQAKQVRLGTAEERLGRKRRATTLDRRQPSRWIHDNRHEAQSEDREQRDVELGRHGLEEQHAVAAAQTAAAQERGTLLRLAIEFGERERPGRATVAIDDGRRVRTCGDLRRQHLDDVHGSARANNVYRRIVRA